MVRWVLGLLDPMGVLSFTALERPIGVTGFVLLFIFGPFSGGLQVDDAVSS